jgi:hypothetical protein
MTLQTYRAAGSKKALEYHINQRALRPQHELQSPKTRFRTDFDIAQPPVVGPERRQNYKLQTAVSAPPSPPAAGAAAAPLDCAVLLLGQYTASWQCALVSGHPNRRIADTGDRGRRPPPPPARPPHLWTAQFCCWVNGHPKGRYSPHSP